MVFFTRITATIISSQTIIIIVNTISTTILTSIIVIIISSSTSSRCSDGSSLSSSSSSNSSTAATGYCRSSCDHLQKPEDDSPLSHSDIIEVVLGLLRQVAGVLSLRRTHYIIGTTTNETLQHVAGHALKPLHCEVAEAWVSPKPFGLRAGRASPSFRAHVSD